MGKIKIDISSIDSEENNSISVNNKIIYPKCSFFNCFYNLNLENNEKRK